MSEKMISFPGVNGMAICDCGETQFRVGIEVDERGNNHIRCLECPSCEHKMPVPFLHTDTRYDANEVRAADRGQADKDAAGAEFPTEDDYRVATEAMSVEHLARFLPPMIWGNSSLTFDALPDWSQETCRKHAKAIIDHVAHRTQRGGG